MELGVEDAKILLPFSLPAQMAMRRETRALQKAPVLIERGCMLHGIPPSKQRGASLEVAIMIPTLAVMMSRRLRLGRKDQG